MSIMGFIPLLLLVAGYAWYVSLISRRNKAREAMSSIDVQLRKRFDLVPNVVKLAQNFMTHEKSLLNELTALRAQVDQPYRPNDPEDVKAHMEAANKLNAGLRQLFAVAENYPELRSSDTIVRAQETFEEVEANIAAARRFYNASVTQLNNAVEIFPGSIIAGFANVLPMPFYEVEEASRAPIDVNDYMKSE
ncbi:MAG: LemA family protein [Rhizobiales bacterium]|nr:LemA family protein [Hyphomicrobiales bacterium]